MEELFKKIQKYKDSVDGPFFCIISDAHATASLTKNMRADVILKDCFGAVWEARKDKEATPATYIGFVIFCALAFLEEHESSLTAADAFIFNHLSQELAGFAKSRKAY